MLRLLLGICLIGVVACTKAEHKPVSEIVKREHPKNHIPMRTFSSDKVMKAFMEERELENWFTKDADDDNAEGTSADKTYEQLHLKQAREVVVAVIDSGVDIHHEDLKGKIWVNAGEIPNNGIDDDNNGYIDDVHGWNYLGGYDANGKAIHVDAETLEVTRELVKMKAKKKFLEDQGMALSKADQVYLDQLSVEVASARSEANYVITLFEGLVVRLQDAYNILKEVYTIPFEDMTLDSVKSTVTLTDEQAEAKAEIVAIFGEAKSPSVARIQRLLGIYQSDLDYYYNESFNPRAEIVKDNPEDFSQIGFGNNDIIGVGADHGTHVAGIIAADRHNNIGVRGIANNVKIMALRAVPNGDERDKDVALAVRYAADNGADIINMSFGKGYSPNKKEVSEAFKYAEEKGLLILHAAGNESANRDLEDRFPARNIYDEDGKVTGQLQSWMDIGASSQYKNRTLTATFTNFGQKNVDIFAPGVNLNSTIPDNQYAIFSGTSMACPAAAGVAALVWAEHPEMSARELKERLMSRSRSRAGLSVRLPSNHTVNVPFETLSITGGIIDAYRALIAD